MKDMELVVDICNVDQKKKEAYLDLVVFDKKLRRIVAENYYPVTKDDLETLLWSVQRALSIMNGEKRDFEKVGEALLGVDKTIEIVKDVLR